MIQAISKLQVHDEDLVQAARVFFSKRALHSCVETILAQEDVWPFVSFVHHVALLDAGLR